MPTPAWLAARMNRPCVIYTRIESGTDEYNNPVYIDGPSYDSLCYIQPLNQVEVLDGRAEVATFLVHLPSSVAGVLDGFARIDVDGLSYEAASPPATFSSFATTDHHVELVVQRGTA